MMATPFFGDVMPRDRFKALVRYLHFNDNAGLDRADRLFKLRPVVDHLNERFRTVYVPERNMATDESLWKFKGRLRFRTYNPKKRPRFGVKVEKTCQSGGVASGYTYQFKIYTGEDRAQLAQRRTGLPPSSQIVLDLNETLLGQGYNIHTDNYFSGPELFDALSRRKTNICGTVRLTRRGMPPANDFPMPTARGGRPPKMRPGQVAYRSTMNGLLALVWMDKRPVKMLSNFHRGQEMVADRDRQNADGTPRRIPQVVQDYNHGKIGVDISDQRTSHHRCTRKFLKWYKTVFMNMVDMSVLNSYLLWKVAGHGGRFLKFKKDLIHEIIRTADLPAYRSRGRPCLIDNPARVVPARFRHFQVPIPPTARTAQPRKRCVVCLRGGTRKDVRYMCKKCEVPLCVHPCNEIYHQ
jgi:hypothetical protein